jgi:Dyp-type peroxidase family
VADQQALTPVDPHYVDLHDVQGNLVGFNKDQQRFLFLQFPDAASGKALLTDLEPLVATAWEVRAFNGLFKHLYARRHDRLEMTAEATWINLALSFAGLQVLGAPGNDAFPPEFKTSMASQAGTLGDAGPSDPAQWIPPFNQPQTIHAMVVIASDSPEDLNDAHHELSGVFAAHGVGELPAQDGQTRPGDNRGREHFGFKDGISQPGIRGVTRSSKTGQDQIATGEFLIGYPDQDGNISGQPQPVVPPDHPGYDPQVITPALPPWTHNGSFLVYRRLQQDVGSFLAFTRTEAEFGQGNPELVAAKLVGRWRTGAPMEHVPGLPRTIDPGVTDPSVAYPPVLQDQKINHFEYDLADADGHAVPRAAHIRKVNPRDADPPTKAESDRHRILRRGIPYGPEFQPDEPAYSGEIVRDHRDRGLQFVCYQSSIARGFAFIQQIWANARDFPQPGDGEDPIISQATDPRQVRIPPVPEPVPMARWVFTTGGEYFFSPSLTGLRALAI